LAWLGTNVARSGERSLAKGVRAALSLVIVQIAIAAALVELQLPAILRSLHQAVGTLVWIVLFALAYRAGTTQRHQLDTLSHARNRTALPADA
jgi:heme A synthase